MYGFEKTSLWSRSLGATANEHEAELERLRCSLRSFHDRAAILVRRIEQSLPGLTIHDVTHLDALWEMADIIAGPGYPLNPLEAFIFGGSVLLHDAAMCFEAYEGGLDAVRETLTWKDAYAVERENNSGLSDDEVLAVADFAALRRLHAERAGDLAAMEWKAPGADAEMFLIDDYGLRTNFGELIGKIATSHHWPIDELEQRLPPQVNSTGDLPKSWDCDPVKIACLLRCADAAHIDNRRAPDFLHALIRRSGLSLDHWVAQNRLSRPSEDRSDPQRESLLYTSSRAFPPSEAAAWWIAFDAIDLVNSELVTANELLESRRRKSNHIEAPPFQIRRVSGAGNPEHLSKTIPTSGWIPCSAKVHVSNVQNLVKNLGGEALYGSGCDRLYIVLRELIQNSRDAIAARRGVDPGFIGHICVSFFKKSNEEYFISVVDDGVGMSLRVLTGHLLDFGTSFWSTSLVQEEFPGLISSGFKSLGKFGIGFYSIFMASENVNVSSRKFDAAVSSSYRLDFPSGLTMRPTLSANSVDLSAQTSTAVVFKLPAGLADGNGGLLRKGGIPGVQEAFIDVCDYVGRLVGGLDVPVKVKNNITGRDSIFDPIVGNFNNKTFSLEWINRISLSKYIPDNKIEKTDASLDRLRPLYIRGGLVGVAAISVQPLNSPARGLITVGGLETGTSNNFLGYLDHDPGSAKRDATGKAKAFGDELDRWADEQMGLLKSAGASSIEMATACCRLANMGLDPTELLCAQFSVTENGVRTSKFLGLDEIFGLMKNGGILILATTMPNFIFCYPLGVEHIQILPTFMPTESAGSFFVLKDDMDLSSARGSFQACLYRAAERRNIKIHLQKGSPIARSTQGPVIPWLLWISDR